MEAENSTAIGERVRHYRTQKGLSLDDLAKICDLTAGFLGRFERGEAKYSNPTVDTLASIARALELSLHDLIPEHLRINQ